MKEFYAPARYRMALPGDVTGVSGGLIFPAGIPAPTLVRRDLTKKYPHLRQRLLDPQFYLARLRGATCRKACVNLASYGWFGLSGIQEYDSDAQSQREWQRQVEARIHRAWQATTPDNEAAIERVVQRCIALEASIGCEAIILPSPLTVDQSTDYSSELAWLDIGLAKAEQLAAGKMRLATIAISDSCLRPFDPWNNDLLSLIVDQITSRAPEGAYVVVEQANEEGYYCTHPNTVGSVLRLAFELKQGGLQRVFIGTVGLVGFLALCVGADAWASGWYRGERRCRFTDFEDKQGRAVPTYYSHRLASEIHLEKDLDRLTQAGILPRIEDETDASRDLLRALKRGQSASSVPAWAYRQSNIQAAQEHFFSAAVRETERISDKTAQECIDIGYQWVKNAEVVAAECFRRGGFNPRTELKHQAAWLEAFERFREATA